jgi:hypothetical protein
VVEKIIVENCELVFSNVNFTLEQQKALLRDRKFTALNMDGRP